MRDHLSHYIKNLVLPCFSFAVIAGVLSTLFIACFQWATGHVVHLSGVLYDAVRAKPIWLPCLIAGAIVLGLVSSFILTHSRTCRGGGIPTAVAAIRGIASFRWVASVFVLPVSALVTFLCGLPLGTEGPCVQMGAAIGDGVVKSLGGKKHVGWRRYIMTGGASAGFSLATGAPITAVLFSMEELHKHFSPLLFSIASVSVLASQLTARFLAGFGFGSVGLFHIEHFPETTLKLVFVPLAVGLLCGCCSVIFTRTYHKIDKLMRITLKKLPRRIKFPAIFACVALIGFFLSEILGTGHHLIEHLFELRTAWYLLVIVFLVRAVFMMVANTAGVTGGIFLPTLAFGALIGAFCAEIFLSVGAIEAEQYAMTVVLGMTAFLGATSRIPITACVFAVEALGCIHNVIFVIVAVASAFLIVETSGIEDFTDVVVETKAHELHAGKTPHSIEVPLTVCENSFVVGKDLKDILWPAECVLLSFDRAPENKGKVGVAVGDVLTVYYTTYDPVATAEEIEVLVGDQVGEIDKIMRPE